MKYKRRKEKDKKAEAEEIATPSFVGLAKLNLFPKATRDQLLTKKRSRFWEFRSLQNSRSKSFLITNLEKLPELRLRLELIRICNPNVPGMRISNPVRQKVAEKHFINFLGRSH